MGFIKTFNELFLPEVCAGCNRGGFTICLNCQNELTKCMIGESDYSHCILCDSMANNFKTHLRCTRDYPYIPQYLFYDYYYKSIARSCILLSKSRKSVAKLLSELLIKSKCIELIKKLKPDLIVPIPTSTTIFAIKASKNPIIIASFLGERLKIPVVDCLAKSIFGQKQALIDKTERFTNATKSIYLKSNIELSTTLEGKTVLIVDDVITTGATMIAASKILMQSGSLKTIAYCVSYDQRHSI